MLCVKPYSPSAGDLHVVSRFYLCKPVGFAC